MGTDDCGAADDARGNCRPRVQVKARIRGLGGGVCPALLPESRRWQWSLRRRRLIRVYSHDRRAGRRPIEELFDTFLHEAAHHLEYTEPSSFRARACGRVPGRMHSTLFWRILGELKGRWADLQDRR